MINPWLVEERVALMPVIGKLLAQSLHRADLAEARVRFGRSPQQIALLFWPVQAEARRRSAVFFLHGGGWNSGNPLLYRFVGHFFAGLGFPTLLGGYRLAPLHRFPTQIDDVCAGLGAGLRAFSERGVSVERVIVGGQSAGAQLAGLLAYQRSREGTCALRQEQLGGYFSISGPLSFADCTQPALRKMISDLMGKRGDWKAADPIGFLRGDERTPAFLMHGDRDPLVDLENTLAFARRLARARSCPLALHLVRGGHHADLVELFVSDQPARWALEKWLIDCDNLAKVGVKSVEFENKPSRG